MNPSETTGRENFDAGKVGKDKRPCNGRTAVNPFLPRGELDLG
jgi:hypothetical protein